MTLSLPNLDNHTYADLVAEAISQIQVEYPEWTDHNPTDTGIILIELLAWLTEMTLYRVNQIPDENYASFLNLLKGEEWEFKSNISIQERQNNLQSEIKKTLLELDQPYRAVTTSDYEKLVLEDWNKSQSDDNKIAKIKCFPQRKLENKSINKGHISLVVIPEHDNFNSIKINLENFIENRKLLGTIIHIYQPEYVSVNLNVKLLIKDGIISEDVVEKATDELRMFFKSFNSGKYWQGKGWPIGRSFYLSELYKILEELEGVDYVLPLMIVYEAKNNVYKINEREVQEIDTNQNQSKIPLADNQLIQLIELECSVWTPKIKNNAGK